MLAPPPVPMPREAPGALPFLVILSVFFLLDLIGAEEAIRTQDVNAGPGITMFGVVLALLIAFFGWAVHRAHVTSIAAAAATPYWERQVRVWEGLVYCHKCGEVNNPASGEHAPAIAIRGLLLRA